MRQAASLDALLAMTPEQLADVDIAEMNLLCATGLPGADDLDVDHCLATLDEWAGLVKSETERHLYRLYDPRYAEHYRHSEARLRAEMLAQVLAEDCGVRYNMDRIRNIDFTNSKDQFIHGMIGDSNGGTCVSMPVLYVAVGRRLGYPLSLVLAKGHVFARWDDSNAGETFNIETTGNGGTGFPPDQHYRSWPHPVTDAEVKAGVYLKPLGPADELACFLAARGHCLLDNGRLSDAQTAYGHAHRLSPKDPLYLAWLNDAVRRQSPHAARTAPIAPWRPQHRRRTDADLHGIQAINEQNRRMMERLQAPEPPTPGHAP